MLTVSNSMDFPSGADGKESACNARDPGSIPGLGRSPGEGMATHSSMLAMGYSPWGHKESDTTELLTHAHIQLNNIFQTIKHINESLV